MAKYNITHACGHPATVNIVGKEKERPRKVSWHESQICEDCKKSILKEEREATNAAAALKAAEQGLPQLLGSLAQIAYGETCRQELFDSYNDIINSISNAIQNGRTPSGREAEADNTLQELQVNLGYLLDNKTLASWWIETNRDYKGNIKALNTKTTNERKKEKDPLPTSPTPNGEPKIYRPNETSLVTETIVLVRVVEQIIELHFREKNDRFREIVKSSGFTWVSGRWERKITSLSGPVIDRAAEIGYELLAAGFIVQQDSSEIAILMINENFKKEDTRWITSYNAGEYNGWFALLWSRKEDLYAAARKIKGSKYCSPHVVVPPEQFVELLKFADQYDFRIAKSVHNIINAQKEARTKQIEVNIKKL